MSRSLLSKLGPLSSRRRLFCTTISLKSDATKSVLITGCAPGGFGNLAVHEFAKNGWLVFAGCHSDRGFDELLRRGNDEYGGRLKPIRLDVTSDESVNNCLGVVKADLKGRDLTGLINNAGLMASAPDDWCTLDEYRRSMDVNAFGMIRMCKAFKPLLKKARGRIVNTTSFYGRISGAGAGPYATSKYAAEAYSDAIRKELVRFGVSVHIVEPGLFMTNMANADLLRGVFATYWHNSPQAVRDEYGEQYFQDALKSIDWTINTLCSKKANKVVDAYYHAMTSSRPRKRYYPGWDSRFFYRYFALMPESVQDWVGSKIGMFEPLVPAATKKKATVSEATSNAHSL